MSITTYELQLDETIQQEAFAVINSYGLTPTQAFQLFLHQITKTKSLPLSFNYQRTGNTQNTDFQENSPKSISDEPINDKQSLVETPFNYDLDSIKKAVESPYVEVPKLESPQAILAWMQSLSAKDFVGQV